MNRPATTILLLSALLTLLGLVMSESRASAIAMPLWRLPLAPDQSMATKALNLGVTPTAVGCRPRRAPGA